MPNSTPLPGLRVVAPARQMAETVETRMRFDIDRNIFMLWETGAETAPPVIATCVSLWRRLNPGWNVQVFDGSALRSLLAQDYPAEVLDAAPVQARSDMLRAKLLAERGGIWVDATCLPTMPVDRWIADFEGRDFCAVPNHAPGRPCCSWFLVSARGGAIMTALAASIRRYWQAPKTLVPNVPAGFARHVDAHWRDFISPYAAETLRIAPYFWFHYHFAKLIETDAAFAREWQEVGWFFDGGYGFVHNSIAATPGNTDEVLNFLRRTPVQCNKLNWKRGGPYPLDDMRRVILERAEREA